MTPDQKNMLVDSLYAAVFDYIAEALRDKGVQAHVPWAKYVVEKAGGFGIASDLRTAYIYDYVAKAKFEARVVVMLDAYIEGAIERNRLPASEPVHNAMEAHHHAQREALAKTLQDTRWDILRRWYEREDFASRDVDSVVASFSYNVVNKLDTIDGGRALYEKALADNNITEADFTAPPGFSCRSSPEFYNECAERYGWEKLTPEQFDEHARLVHKHTAKRREAYEKAQAKDEEYFKDLKSRLRGKSQ